MSSLHRLGAGAAVLAALVVAGGSPALAAGTTTPTTAVSTTPLAFDTTNGDILAITKVAGASSSLLAIGGNFTAVITPDGKSHAAKNLAIVDEATGAVRYAGSANSYVRAFASRAGILYVGGDFTTLAGSSRAHLAAVNTTGFTLTSFNPKPSARVRALAVDSTGLYYGGDVAAVRKVSLSSSATIWSQSIVGGGTHALTLAADGSALFVGGLFEKYGSLTRHGVVKASASTGSPVSAFNAHLKADTTTDGFDGEEGLSFSLAPESANIVLGIGGHGENEVRKVNATTGATVWNKGLVADCQAVVPVGDTYVVGYHRNAANGSVNYPYFSGQVEGSNASLTTWDPRVTGIGGNADGGNNGVQAAYADPTTKTLFLAGAFTKWNNTSTHRSLIAFRWS